MPFRLGETAFDALKRGTADIVARYVGEAQVWPEGYVGRGQFAFAGTGALRVERNLSGSGSFGFTGVGAFDESAISGSGSFGFSGSGSLSVTRTLAGAGSFSFAATGTLIKIQQLSANGTFTFEGSATVDSAGFTRGFSIGFRS